MSFTLNNYLYVPNAISRELADFCNHYFLMKRSTSDFLYNNKLVQETPLLGYRRDMQVPGAYSHYADIVMETLLERLIPTLNYHTGLDLVPTYSYARIYEKGNVLARHKDRPSCEISATLNLGGDTWPIFIDPTGSDSVISLKDNIIKANAPEGKKIILEPGDLLIYAGCELEHWREPFEGDSCAQVFLHYNKKGGKFGKSNLFDKRPALGLPRLSNPTV